MVQYGRHRQRRSYARISEVLELPNLIEIQTASYDWFLEEGLKEMFQDISPIEDFSGNLSLEFIDYSLDEPKYSVEEAKERDVTYNAPLRDRKSTRLNSSHVAISYAVFCLKKKKKWSGGQ